MTLSGTNGLGRHFTKFVRDKVDVNDLCAERLTTSENGNTLQISLPQFDNLRAARGGKISNGDFAMGYSDSPTGVAPAHVTLMEHAAAESVDAMLDLGAKWVTDVAQAGAAFVKKFNDIVSGATTQRVSVAKSVETLQRTRDDLAAQLSTAETRPSAATSRLASIDDNIVPEQNKQCRRLVSALKKADKDYADSGHCVFAAKSSSKLRKPGFLVQMERNDIKPLKVYYNTGSDDGSSDEDKGAKHRSAAHAQHARGTRYTEFDIFPKAEGSKPTSGASISKSRRLTDRPESRRAKAARATSRMAAVIENSMIPYSDAGTPVTAGDRLALRDAKKAEQQVLAQLRDIGGSEASGPDLAKHWHGTMRKLRDLEKYVFAYWCSYKLFKQQQHSAGSTIANNLQTNAFAMLSWQWTTKSRQRDPVLQLIHKVGESGNKEAIGFNPKFPDDGSIDVLCAQHGLRNNGGHFDVDGPGYPQDISVVHRQ